ncbi:MAG: metalloregulator ArsR/SmtB family transcription factor [Actinobacteria bacterium]|nr:metalloregulator ArsR/SmtB family transcription factor [Actinomycetota bacterium]MCL6104529.1 metalloregulator ArsR/SmtB family transcription factor [Actinomycetota bacterium]
MSIDITASSQQEVDWLGSYLKALADPLRWHIVRALANEQLCVCHLASLLNVSQPLASHHLRILKNSGLVETEHYRYWTYYRLRPQALAQLASIFAGMASQAPTETERRRSCD